MEWCWQMWHNGLFQIISKDFLPKLKISSILFFKEKYHDCWSFLISLERFISRIHFCFPPKKRKKALLIIKIYKRYILKKLLTDPLYSSMDWPIFSPVIFRNEKKNWKMSKTLYKNLIPKEKKREEKEKAIYRNGSRVFYLNSLILDILKLSMVIFFKEKKGGGFGKCHKRRSIPFGILIFRMEGIVSMKWRGMPHPLKIFELPYVTAACFRIITIT